MRWSHARNFGNRSSNSCPFIVTTVLGVSLTSVLLLKYSKRNNLASEQENMRPSDDAAMCTKVRHQGDSDKFERNIPHFFSRVSAEHARIAGWAVTTAKACTVKPSSVANNISWQAGSHPGVGGRAFPKRMFGTKIRKFYNIFCGVTTRNIHRI